MQVRRQNPIHADLAWSMPLAVSCAKPQYACFPVFSCKASNRALPGLLHIKLPTRQVCRLNVGNGDLWQQLSDLLRTPGSSAVLYI